MLITKAKEPKSYHLENDGAFTPFTSISLSTLGTLFFMNRDTVALFFGGLKRDEILNQIHELGIKVIEEKGSANG
tara:strand:+ start:397 stop:621 length:225 start_codon:yes stop_codon:yes gene_type:complete